MITIDVQVTVNGEAIKSEELNNVVSWWLRQKLVSQGSVGNFAGQENPKTPKVRKAHNMWDAATVAKFIDAARPMLNAGDPVWKVAKELSVTFEAPVTTLDQRIRRYRNAGML